MAKDFDYVGQAITAAINAQTVLNRRVGTPDLLECNCADWCGTDASEDFAEQGLDIDTHLSKGETNRVIAMVCVINTIREQLDDLLKRAADRKPPSPAELADLKTAEQKLKRFQELVKRHGGNYSHRYAHKDRTKYHNVDTEHLQAFESAAEHMGFTIEIRKGTPYWGQSVYVLGITTRKAK